MPRKLNGFRGGMPWLESEPAEPKPQNNKGPDLVEPVETPFTKLIRHMDFEDKPCRTDADLFEGQREDARISNETKRPYTWTEPQDEVLARNSLARMMCHQVCPIYFECRFAADHMKNKWYAGKIESEVHGVMAGEIFGYMYRKRVGRPRKAEVA